jgi:hypothetical protein
MPNPEQRPPITLEQLLQLKRAERPDAEFWTKFDAELRQKQLAALVQRRAWWQQLPHLFARRAYLPIGAAAVLTFTFVSVRHYAPDQVTLAEAELPASVRTVPAVPRADLAADRELAAVAAAPLDESEPVSVQRFDDRTAVAAAPQPLSSQLPAQTSELVPWSARVSGDSPSARSIAANLARLEETEPELVHALLGPRMADTGYSLSDAAAHAVQVSAIGGLASRRNRVLAALQDRQFTQDPSAPEVVRERLARRLGDTEVAGGWTRVGVKADRVSLKF